MHALTHVMYETGQHEAGRTWLDHWVAESGRSAGHRAHFSWHAALHELALGDTEAVRRRYYSQLSPPGVAGVRALVDAASLLWRWRVTTADWDHAFPTPSAQPAFPGEGPPPPVQPVLDAVEPALLVRPETPFVALHAALALAAAEDRAGLELLRRHCLDSPAATMRTVVASVCEALVALGEERWDDAARTLADVLPVLDRVGGSAAQREIVEETLFACLVHGGRAEQAAGLLSARLDRRDAPADRRRLRSLRAARTGGQPVG